MKIAEYKKLTQPRESMIQTEIIWWLKTNGWYCQRLNAGKYAIGEGRARRMVVGVESGTPDIMAFKRVLETGKDSFGLEFATIDELCLLFIEVKRPGNKPTPIQLRKMAELEEYGARCVVAHSLEELQDKL